MGVTFANSLPTYLVKWKSTILATWLQRCKFLTSHASSIPIGRGPSRPIDGGPWLPFHPGKLPSPTPEVTCCSNMDCLHAGTVQPYKELCDARPVSQQSQGSF